MLKLKEVKFMKNIRPFYLERIFAKYEFNAPYLLCSSDCESISIKELLSLSSQYEKNLEDFLNIRLGYTESLGNPYLRSLIASMYNENNDEKFTEENILVFSGAQEGIFLTMNTLISPEDHVICIYPCYQSLYEIAKGIGAQISFLKCKEEKNWACDFASLEELVQKNTRMIIVNFPHNPTGYLPSRNDFQYLIDFCAKRDIILFSDEVYRFLEYDLDNRENPITDSLPGAYQLYQNAVSLGVLSKSFGLAGLRIGWIASQNKNLIRQIALNKDYTTICNSAPSEFLAILALKNKDKIISKIRGIVFDNLKLLDEFFKKYNEIFKYIPPRGGSVLFATLLEGEADKFCEKVVEKKGVMLMPSTAFEFDNQHIRFGFGRKNMPEALEIFEQFIKEEYY